MADSRGNDDQPNRNGRTKYYLPRIDLKNIMLLLMDEELKKVMIGKGEDYTTGSLLDYDYF